jgi:hypothetical protein
VALAGAGGENDDSTPTVRLPRRERLALVGSRFAMHARSGLELRVSSSRVLVGRPGCHERAHDVGVRKSRRAVAARTLVPCASSRQGHVLGPVAHFERAGCEGEGDHARLSLPRPIGRAWATESCAQLGCGRAPGLVCGQGRSSRSVFGEERNRSSRSVFGEERNRSSRSVFGEKRNRSSRSVFHRESAPSSGSARPGSGTERASAVTSVAGSARVSQRSRRLPGRLG